MNTKTKHWSSITAGILSLASYASAASVASVGSEKYTYDQSGNITEKSIDGEGSRMVYDHANRLVGHQVADQSKNIIAYDAAGRPVTVLNEEGQSIRRTGYGYGGKVIEIKNQDSNADFYYNAEGQLVGKQANGNVSTYTWDGSVLSAEDADAFTNEDHVSGGVPVLASGTEAVVSDHLGNTLASGAKQFAGTAYGEGLEKGRFTGKVFVKELDSFTFHHRLYSPASNRWDVADPSGFPDGENSYMYVRGNPLSSIDPLGLSTLKMNYKWTYTIGSATVATGDWEGSHVWSTVKGHESSSILVTPGWVSGTNYYGLQGGGAGLYVKVDPIPTDTSSWEMHPTDSNLKRYVVNQEVLMKQTETVGQQPIYTTLKTFSKTVNGTYIEL